MVTKPSLYLKHAEYHIEEEQEECCIQMLLHEFLTRLLLQKSIEKSTSIEQEDSIYSKCSYFLLDLQNIKMYMGSFRFLCSSLVERRDL